VYEDFKKYCALENRKISELSEELLINYLRRKSKKYPIDWQFDKEIKNEQN